MADIRSRDYDDRTDEAPVKPPIQPDAVELEPNEARQGVTHHNVRTVLAISTLGCVVLMVLAYLVFFA